MSSTPSPGPGRLTGGVGLFVLLGVPLVAYLWETLNRVLSGRFEGERILLALPVSLLLAGLLVWIARTIHRWQHSPRRDPLPRPSREPSPAPVRAGAGDPYFTALAPDEEPVVVGTLFLAIVVLMIVAALWAVLYLRLGEL